NQRVLLVSLS
ncbi:hypothetical protein D046_5621D, partial [Vibrio parahaemolyticus V-223/04]